jgi:hypothetical protein
LNQSSLRQRGFPKPIGYTREFEFEFGVSSAYQSPAYAETGIGYGTSGEFSAAWKGFAFR